MSETDSIMRLQECEQKRTSEQSSSTVQYKMMNC